jgi:hypothetical protein
MIHGDINLTKMDMMNMVAIMMMMAIITQEKAMKMNTTALTKTLNKMRTVMRITKRMSLTL